MFRIFAQKRTSESYVSGLFQRFPQQILNLCPDCELQNITYIEIELCDAVGRSLTNFLVNWARWLLLLLSAVQKDAFYNVD